MSEFFVNGATALDATALNKVMMGDTYTNGYYMLVAYRVQYDGANWVVSTAFGTEKSAGAVAAAWNAGDYRLDLTLTLTRPFTNTPCVVALAQAGSSHASQPRYSVQAHATGTGAAIVRFIDLTAPTNYVTAVSTKMVFSIIFVGLIDA